MRLVAPDGEQIGVKKLSEAIWLADQLGLDLVEVAPGASPPVVRLMDYGKYKYEQSVRNREARKRQTRTVIKEIKFKPKISQHDYDVKRRKAEEFLAEGDKIKVTLWFRGREVDHPEVGREILDRLIYDLDDLANLEQPPAMDGRNMTMVLGPVRRRAADSAESLTEQEVQTGEEL